MKKAVLYIHGKGGNASEAEHYKPLLPDYDVFGLDYKSAAPWEAKEEFPAELDRLSRLYDSVLLIANSIGAFFSMCTFEESKIEKAFFISPVVNMERLISDMMLWAGVTEAELREKKIIKTDFGEDLSWEYLCYVREHPLRWKIPTKIIYGGKDNLTSIDTVTEFADKTGAELAVLPDGEHWFHTEEQMKFLDEELMKFTDVNRSVVTFQHFGIKIKA